MNILKLTIIGICLIIGSGIGLNAPLLQDSLKTTHITDTPKTTLNPSRKIKVRCTAYSPLERNEGKLGMRNNRITNERGVAVSKDLLKIMPYGTRIKLPDGSVRIVDDTTNRRLRKTCDIRYYNSLNRKKSIKKQLLKRDKGYGWVGAID